MPISCSPEECLNVGKNKLLSVDVAFRLLDIAEVEKIIRGYIHEKAQTVRIQRWTLSVRTKWPIYITACLQHKGKQWAHREVFHKRWVWPSLSCSLWTTRKWTERELCRPELLAFASCFAEEELGRLAAKAGSHQECCGTFTILPDQYTHSYGLSHSTQWPVTIQLFLK